MYRQRKTKGKREVSYRTVESKKAEALRSEGKIKAVVTGGSGSLGKQIVRCLIEDGNYLIYSLDLFIPDEENRNDNVYSYIQADIFDKDSLGIALKDTEVVFHTAGIIPNFVGYTKQDFYDVIATGTENIVSVCKELRVKRLIYTSTVNVMVQNNLTVDNLDETTPYPEQCRGAYDSAKIVAEKCILGTNGMDGILTCALRPCFIADSKSIESFGQLYFGDGLYKQMLIPPDTVARIHILVEKKLRVEGLASKIAGKAYNVAFEDSFTHRELAEFVASEKGGEAGSIPIWVLKLMVHFNEYVYRVIGKAPISPMLRIDAFDYMIKSHTYSSALGRKEIGWEDPRIWKDVVRELIKEGKESKKNN